MFFRVAKLIILFFMVFGQGCSVSKHHELVTYTALMDIGSGEDVLSEEIEIGTLVLDRSANEAVLYERIVSSDLDCGTESWICLTNGFFQFAIPKDWDGQIDSWNYKGVEYSLLRSPEFWKSDAAIGSYFIVGRRLDAPSESLLLPTVYVYHPDEGLISFMMYVSGLNGKPAPVIFVRTP